MVSHSKEFVKEFVDNCRLISKSEADVLRLLIDHSVRIHSIYNEDMFYKVTNLKLHFKLCLLTSSIMISWRLDSGFDPASYPDLVNMLIMHINKLSEDKNSVTSKIQSCLNKYSEEIQL